MPGIRSGRAAILLALGVAAALASVPAAFAQPRPPEAPDAVRADAGYFGGLAAALGCPKPAWAGVDRGVLTIEYVPQDEEVASWRNLVTVTVVPVPDGMARGAASNGYIEDFLAAVRQPGSSLEEVFEKRYAPDGARAAWILYSVGAGALKEHNAAAVVLVAPGELMAAQRRWAVVNVQRQQRGGRLDRSWIDVSRKLFADRFEKPDGSR